MEKSKTVIILIAALILISVGYTAWSFIQQAPDKNKFAKYRPATATITEKLPGRISRYGAKPLRYHITFTAADGQQHTASNVDLGGDRNPGDTITIYYNPEHPSDDVVRSLP